MQAGTRARAAWWARWRQESVWTQRELAKICCGLDPGDESITDPVAYNAAMNGIVRAYRIGDLRSIALTVPADRAEMFYGDGVFFRPTEAVAWATDRYPLCPYRPADMVPVVADPHGGADPVEPPVGRRRTSKNPLHEARYRLLDRVQRTRGITKRKELCAFLACSIDTLRGIVREDPTRVAPSKTQEVLAKLGLSPDEWARPQ